MIVLAGGASLIVGNAYQAQMPEFAHDLGHADAGITYSMLLAADAAGALVAGLVLESRGLLQPNPRTAFVLAMLWCVAIGGFALPTVLSARARRCCSSPASSSSPSSPWRRRWCSSTRPPQMRGRVIGLFTMSALGLRAFSGITVGLGGSLIGIHWSLALSAALLLALTVLFLFMSKRA